MGGLPTPGGMLSRGWLQSVAAGQLPTACFHHGGDASPDGRSDDVSCKFWLSPVGLASNLGFRASELRDIERLIEDNADDLLQKWEEFHVEPR